MRRVYRFCFAMLAVLMMLTGCRNDSPGVKDAGKNVKKNNTKPQAHDHGAGPHGGVLAEWGSEDYHVEFTVDHEKQQVTAYILGSDAKTLTPIEAAKILLSIKQPSFQIDLLAAPHESDPKGKSSRYIGKHEKFGKEQEFAGTISGEVNGKPYAGDFKEEAHDHDKEKSGKANATGDVNEREAKVFLTPGGLYTKADIEKNGNATPSVKFKGVFWQHDDSVKAGQRVCPVTDNKADPQCYWWINDKKYEFCCPPCLEKFVKWAKETPDKVKAPEAYVKR